MRAVAAALASLVAAGWPSEAYGQAESFFDELRRTRAVLVGTFGDQGMSIPARIDSVRERLDAWDASVRESEASYRAQLATAQASDAVRIHAALAEMFLERSRLVDALEEYDAASRLVPAGGEFELSRGLILEALGRAAEAADAYRTARARRPGDPVAAYLVLTRTQPDAVERARLREVLSRAQQEAVAGRSRAPENPFLPVRAFGDPRPALPVFSPARYVDAFGRHLAGAHEQGLSALRAAAASDPLVVDPAAALPGMRQAGGDLYDGDLAAAIVALEGIVERLPDSSEAHRMLGIGYELAGDLDRAIEQFERAIGLRHDDERSWLALVRTREMTADVAEVRRTLEDAVAAVPRSGALRVQLAELVRRRDEGGVALSHYTELARLPVVAGEAGLHRWESELAYLVEDVERAIQAAERRIRLIPADPGAHRDLARLHTSIGRHENAFDELAFAAWLNPDDGATLAALGLNFLARGDASGAVAPLERAVAVAPMRRDARSALAQALTRLGRRDEARKQLEVFRELQQDWLAQSRVSFAASSFRRRAEIATAAGQYDRAVEAWSQVVVRAPGNVEAYVHLADALLHVGRPDTALQALVQAADRGGFARVHLRIAQVLTLLGRDAEAATGIATYQRLHLEDLKRAALR